MLHSIQLYSVYYKPFPFFPNASFVIPIQAGAQILHANSTIIGDDTGDHISSKNPLYSELTALYWILKNTHRTSSALGLCHYRRYLIHDQYKLLLKKRSRYYVKASQENLDSFLRPSLYSRYQELLSEYDVIVPRLDYSLRENGVTYTVEEAYERAHIKKDWDVTMKTVGEKYPEYQGSIEVLGRQEKMFYNNIMIAPWSIWDNYAEWLFDILNEVEKRIDLPKEGYQKRVMGFLAERLHNLFVLHNNLKTAYLTLGLLK